MVVRLRVAIEQDEYASLLKWALAEMRNPEDQLHYIVRRELIALGLLSDKNQDIIGAQDRQGESSKGKGEANRGEII